MVTSPDLLATSLKMLLASGLEEIARVVEAGDAAARAALVADLRAGKPDVPTQEEPPREDARSRVELGVWVADQPALRPPGRDAGQEVAVRVPVLVTAYRGRPEEPLLGAWHGLWKTLRSLAFKGRRFETWEQMEEAVEKATAYWNAHKLPFVWGRRTRQRPRGRADIAVLPKGS